MIELPEGLPCITRLYTEHETWLHIPPKCRRGPSSNLRHCTQLRTGMPCLKMRKRYL